LHAGDLIFQAPGFNRSPTSPFLSITHSVV
jgi:hypothetical protein